MHYAVLFKWLFGFLFFWTFSIMYGRYSSIDHAYIKRSIRTIHMIRLSVCLHFQYRFLHKSEIGSSQLYVRGAAHIHKLWKGITTIPLQNPCNSFYVNIYRIGFTEINTCDKVNFLSDCDVQSVCISLLFWFCLCLQFVVSLWLCPIDDLFNMRLMIAAITIKRSLFAFSLSGIP